MWVQVDANEQTKNDGIIVRADASQELIAKSNISVKAGAGATFGGGKNVAGAGLIVTNAVQGPRRSQYSRL